MKPCHILLAAVVGLSVVATVATTGVVVVVAGGRPAPAELVAVLATCLGWISGVLTPRARELGGRAEAPPSRQDGSGQPPAGPAGP